MMRARLILVVLSLTVPSAGAWAAAAPPLVAACFGCHPVNGGDSLLPRLAGRNADEIAAAMKAFRSGTRPATVMDRIAKGFTDDEIAVIAAWYAEQ
jgi:cytochrome subunit of sulfide dehydrogenase